MAATVTVEDPDTGDTFRATRRQFDTLHKPRGRVIILDENGDTVKPKRKTKADTSATED